MVTLDNIKAIRELEVLDSQQKKLLTLGLQELKEDYMADFFEDDILTVGFTSGLAYAIVNNDYIIELNNNGSVATAKEDILIKYDELLNWKDNEELTPQKVKDLYSDCEQYLDDYLLTDMVDDDYVKQEIIDVLEDEENSWREVYYKIEDIVNSKYDYYKVNGYGNLVELTTNDLMNYVDEMIEELEDKIFN